MFTHINRFMFPTFGLYLTIAIVTAIGITVYQHQRQQRHAALVDCLLSAVGLGWLGARLEYVLLNGALFQSDWRTVFDMSTGGLDWHGAVWGAVLGLALMAHWRNMSFLQVLTALTPAIPLIAFATWTAARRIGLAYGQEVETLAYYPAWLVTEGRDIFGIIAPRYDTHRFGQILAWGLWVGIIPSMMRGQLSPMRFWWVLGAVSVGMFGIGFLRGDVAPIVYGLRLDQWLDLLMLVFAVIGAWFTRRRIVA